MARGKPTPQHALFIRYGKFQLGAVGRPAIFAIIAVVAGLVGTKMLGVW